MIKLTNFIKKAADFCITTTLSCGPSQAFGCVKLFIDAVLYRINNNRKNKIIADIRKVNSDWKAFKTSRKVGLIAKKLGIKPNNLTQAAAKNYYNAELKQVEAKCNRLRRCILADACALIPLVGVRLSRKVASQQKEQNTD